MQNDPVNPPFSREKFCLGTWFIDPALNRISSEGSVQQIEPRIMDVLLCLASDPGRVRSRQEILHIVWHDAVVGEEALTRAISELRRVLGDSSQKSQFIETIRKGGYRLVADVAPDIVPDISSTETQKAQPELGTATQSMGTSRRLLVSIPLLLAVVFIAFWFFQKAENNPPAILNQPLAVEPLTSYPGSERMPAISPDGNMVVFMRKPIGQEDTNIFIKQVGEENSLQLTDRPGYNFGPVWSPDGLSITYVHYSDNTTTICSVPILGGQSRTLFTAQNRIFGLGWSPDGYKLAYSDVPEPGAAAQIFLRDATTGTTITLTTNKEIGRGDTQPQYSPDGSTIAFVRTYRSRKSEILLIPANGGETSVITKNERPISGITWSGDGKSLVFASAMNGNYSLWRVNVSDGELNWLPLHGEWMFFPSIARDADRLVYQHSWFEKNIWQVVRSVDSEHELSTQPIITSSHWDCEAYFSPDGKRLAFISTRSGNLEIWACAADGSKPSQVTDFGGPSVGSPAWAADNNTIAFGASPDGYSDLHLIDSETLELTRLTQGDYNNQFPCWSFDRLWLYYASDRSGRWEIWKLRISDFSDNNAQQVTFDGGIASHITEDGKNLYYSKPGEPGIWALALTGEGAGETKQIIADYPSRGDWGNWSLWREGIIVLKYDNEGPILSEFSFVSGKLTEISHIPNAASWSVAVSPDGQTMLHARVERSVQDLILVKGVN